MALRKATRDMPPQSMRAVFSPDSIDAEARTVDLTWSTGAAVMRGFFDQYWEELSMQPKHVRMGRLKSGGAPLLNAHSMSNEDVIGVVESASIDGKSSTGTAKVRFAKDEASDAIFRKVTDGILRNVSIGYRVFKMEKISDGEGQIPVFRAVDWEPYEISIVPVGADAGATVRASEANTNTCIFEETTMDPEDINESGETRNIQPPPAATAVAPASQATAHPANQSPAVDVESIRAAERQRILGIERIGRALRRPADEIQRAIDKGTPLESFRASAQDAFADGETITFERGVRIDSGEDARDKWQRGASAWIFQRSSLSQLVGADAERRGFKVDLDPGEFRGLRMIDLARQALERSGVSTKGMSPMEIAGAALTQRSSPGYASTGDFPVLLENTLHKVMQASFGNTPDKWTRFCSRGTVSDFKPHKRYRMGSFGSLSPLNENGEFANKAIPDGGRETQQATTKGNIIGITRRAIIDDDMGAFTQLATGLGRAARLSIESDVFALLALNGGLGPLMNDGLTLFHATHGNISTGAALSATALDADRVAMGLQKDLSNNELLELRPSILVLPIGLGGVARVINDSAYDPDTLANKAQMKANIAGKMFDDIVDTGRISGTRRYLFADPRIVATIEVAFLDGQDMPVLEMQQGWRVDGMEWKARLDYGVAAVEYRGAITNAGA